MFLREVIHSCSVCQEVTPHSYRTVAVPQVLSFAFLGGAGLCAWLGPEYSRLAVILGFLGLILLTRDRGEMWRIHCERCRTKKLAEAARTKPTLDGTTTIDF